MFLKPRKRRNVSEYILLTRKTMRVSTREIIRAKTLKMFVCSVVESRAVGLSLFRYAMSWGREKSILRDAR